MISVLNFIYLIFKEIIYFLCVFLQYFLCIHKKYKALTTPETRANLNSTTSRNR